MSTITTAYDKIVTDMEATFPSHKRLTNPYDLRQNNELFTRQGWGLRLDTGINTNRELSCQRLSIVRNVSLILTRKYYAVEHDVEAKADTEKQLLEDQLLLLNTFLDDSVDLDGAVTRFHYLSDGGIQFIYTEKDLFLSVSTDFEMEYFENIT